MLTVAARTCITLNLGKMKYESPVLPVPHTNLANILAEHSFARCHQGIRGQQVEGDRTKDWKASQGKGSVSMILGVVLILILLGMRAIRQGALQDYLSPDSYSKHCLSGVYYKETAIWGFEGHGDPGKGISWLTFMEFGRTFYHIALYCSEFG
jgi:hypothetical protein